MAKVLVLYYSMYGHIETMAQAVAEGAKSVSGAEVTILRVPESMDAERFAQVGGKVNQAAAEAKPEDLTQYDAIIVGTPTRFGNMAGQMRNFGIAPADCGPQARCTANSPVCSPLPAPVAVRNKPSPLFGPPSPITAWLSSPSVMAPKNFSIFLRYAAVRLMAPPPLRVVMAPASHLKKNWELPAIRANTSPDWR